MRLALALAIALLLFPAPAPAQEGPGAVVEVPLVDFPDNYEDGLRVPSMQQSLAFSAAFYELAHAGIEQAFGERRVWGKIAAGLFDLVTTVEATMPLSSVWLHEEFHRAVLSNRGIDSRNDVYDLDFGADAIAVSRIRDEDLIRLKRDHPADSVRLGSAGMEGELMLVQRLQKNRFFSDSRGWHLPLYWLTKVGTTHYLYSGGTAESDDETDEMNLEDGADIPRRDFTGHDFNGWVYDLFRPDEPYEARGIHPSGVGIDRYRKSTHLTAEERAYLDRQGQLTFINFLDPTLIGIERVTLRRNGRPIDVNVSASHLLTSFGYTVDANLFLRAGHRKLFVVLHRYANGERSFPGVEMEWIDHPLTIGTRAFSATPRLALWLQPEHQRFRDEEAKAGGLAGIRLSSRGSGRYAAFVELDTKSAGWVAGNVHLGSNTSLRIGLTAAVF